LKRLKNNAEVVFAAQVGRASESMSQGVFCQSGSALVGRSDRGKAQKQGEGLCRFSRWAIIARVSRVGTLELTVMSTATALNRWIGEGECAHPTGCVDTEVLVYVIKRI